MRWEAQMSSKARKRFDENCKDVERLMKIHQDIAGELPGRKYGVEVLNKSAIVLICAFWEAFVEDLLEEALEFIVHHVTDPQKLPLDLRKTIARAVKQDKNELSPWDLADGGWKSILASNLTGAKGKYLTNWNTPKSANIRELYLQALGFPDLPAKWQRSWLSNQKAIKRLDDFVVLRGAIAHRGKAGQSVKKVVVKDSLAHIKELVQFTDVAVNGFVAGIVGQKLY
jgi:hypothetical protein